MPPEGVGGGGAVVVVIGGGVPKPKLEDVGYEENRISVMHSPYPSQ